MASTQFVVHWRRRLARVSFLLVLVSISAFAQESNSQQRALRPRVEQVVGALQLDDLIEVHVENLSDWASSNDPAKLVPYINGLAISGNYPEEINTERGRLIYHLEITSQNRQVWTDLLGAPTQLRRAVTFTVGLESQTPFESMRGRDNPMVLTVVSPVYGLVSLVLSTSILLALIWLALKTNIIRELGPDPASGKRRPYSLGRTQMAFWFFLTVTSYLVLWLITDNVNTITPSLLALMGISVTAALGEALIDSEKRSGRAARLQTLPAEKQALEQGIADLEDQISNISAKNPMGPDDLANRHDLSSQLQTRRTRLNEVNQQLMVSAEAPTERASAGFLRDMVCDSGGYSINRFQAFVWTIVMGLVFISSVYNSLTMPEFSGTMLGLLGISSGTYVGFAAQKERT